MHYYFVPEIMSLALYWNVSVLFSVVWIVWQGHLGPHKGFVDSCVRMSIHDSGRKVED